MMGFVRRLVAWVLRQLVFRAPKTAIRVLNDYYDAQPLEAFMTPAGLSSAADIAALYVGTVRPSVTPFIRFDLDEAMYLFEFVRSLPEPSVVEIGRWRGGSTLLLAAAIRGRGALLSIDNHALADRRHRQGAEDDAACRALLARYGLSATLAVGDSSVYPLPAAYNCVLVDGDHSSEAVRADCDRWGHGLPAGGHLLVADTDMDGVAMGMMQAKLHMRDSGYALRRTVGALAHYVKERA